MIGLMDCNNFFVSCERLFRPDLAKCPVAVLSSNDGCIVSRSQEVKDLGIAMGVPYFEVKSLCKKYNITLFSSNFTLYRDISTRVMATLKEFVDDIEIYSIDEAFFGVPKTMDETTLISIRAEIIRKTGIPVSIGVAPTKTLAKVANDRAKKGGGVMVLTKEVWKILQGEVSCSSIWGIGRQTSQKLTELGINSVAELLARDRLLYR
jgi:DNA polymerase V